MKTLTTLLLAAFLCGPGIANARPQASSTNPQDVPKQQPPGTNNPDIGKQRRPAPAQPDGVGSGSTNGEDVPKQQPGTDNPDVAKQRRPTGETGDTSSNSGSKQTGSQKKYKRKSTAS